MRLFSSLLKTLTVITLGLPFQVPWIQSKEIPFSFSVFSKFETDFKEFDQSDKSLNLILGLGVNYKLNKKSSISLGAPFIKSFSGTKEFNYLDGSLGLNYTFFNNEDGYSLKTHLGIGLPYSKNSRESNYLQTKITFSPTLTYKVKSIPELSLSITPGLTKNFHRSNTNIHGSSNNSSIWSISGGGTYQIKSKGSFSLKGSVLKLITYGGFEKDRYNFESSYSLPLTKNLMGKIALSNGGEVTDYNGDLNVKLFEAEKALVSLSLYYSF